MNTELADLGLTAFFTQQLTAEEFESGHLARVTEVQRSHVVASDGRSEKSIELGSRWFQLPASERPTVGDWVLLDQGQEKVIRLLERKSIFKRVAAGTKTDIQLIAANIDTLFIATSCNEEFNESRLERYLALAIEAQVDPVVVLTKSDLCDDPDSFRARVQSVDLRIPVEVVNSLDPISLQGLADWITPGATVALVGSSGVGKSTIVNSLSGDYRTETGAIREDDAKGRHTTSYRALHKLPNGGLLLDVPGMRELKVADLASSLSEVFGDVEFLAAQCRFSDCNHGNEPGCALRSALENGTLAPRRLENYRKLERENRHNSMTLTEQRQQGREFSKTIKKHLQLKRDLGGRQGHDN